MSARRIQLWIASAFALAGVSAFYCFSPQLPEITSRLGAQWEWRSSYYRGRTDAAVQRLTGKLRYSFNNYPVDGLAEYASTVDGIASPPNADRGSAYVMGFDEGMISAIRRKVGTDFPDGYVQRYLAQGALDMTKNQPTVCPVHGENLHVASIPFEVVFPFTMARPKFDWEIAGETRFPFPGSTKKVDASWRARPKYARVRVCESCTKAEAEWWASQKHAEPPRAAKPPLADESHPVTINGFRPNQQ